MVTEEPGTSKTCHIIQEGVTKKDLNTERDITKTSLTLTAQEEGVAMTEADMEDKKEVVKCLTNTEGKKGMRKIWANKEISPEEEVMEIDLSA